MERDDILLEKLFQKYLTNSITKEEYESLLVYFKDENQDGYSLSMIEQFMSTEVPAETQGHEEMLNRIESNLKTRLKKTSKVKPLYRYYIPYAAALLIAIFGAGYFYFEYRGDSQQILAGKGIADIVPGNNRASITLSNGTNYSLSESESSVVIGNNGIQYTNGDKIVSNAEGQTVSLTTPKGGQYRVVLSDGTKVMLNSSSSLTYPIQFSGSERSVQLKGEGYFEVAKNVKRPFIVETTDQKISVLGTKFNVYAYESDPMETTLLEGSIKQRSMITAQAFLLVPGQQVVSDDGGLRVREVNTNDYVAWTEGVFVFNNTPMKQLFRQLERWYDIEILYTEDVEDSHFYAEIPRTYNLSKVLYALEKVSKLRFSQKGRRVYVSK